MARVAIIGAGAWGTALSIHAARLSHDVLLWAREPEVVESISRRRENDLFLPGAKLGPSVDGSGDLHAVVSLADLVLFVTPSQHFRAMFRAASPFLPKGVPLLIASKGIEDSTLMLLSDVAREEGPALSARLGFLSGPSFAREVASGLPTDIVVASESASVCSTASSLLHAWNFRVYTSSDPVGVQIGGAMKNVIAIAAGAADGLSLGANARASLLTRGLAEMTRLGTRLGADPLTFLGLSGVGDLLLTATGELSRNRTLGKRIAGGERAEDVLRAGRAVAEGFTTALAARALGRKLGVELPITDQVAAVLHEGRPLLEAMRQLVSREQKGELAGIS